MVADLGIIALFLAFAASGLGTLLALVGATTHNFKFVVSGRNALLATLPLLGIVAGLLIYAQWRGIYQIAYVANVSKDTQPDALKITALWGGQAGSLILWSFMLSLFLAAALLLNWKTERKLIAWVMVVSGITLTFFLILNNFFENPFERTWAEADGTLNTALFAPDGAIPAYPYQSEMAGPFYHTTTDGVFPDAVDARYDGHGLNPLLRHPGMIIHPPMLYLGFTGFMIPFSFAMAAMLGNDLNGSWIRATRRWSLIAWMFLSMGLILGGRWAYDVLGWGGYWGWDPVENSSFLPWLTGTAFLHSVMIQERRGMLKGWNMVMIILTYLLVIFGTVATRTGLLSSVHSFAQSPLALPMGLFLAGMVIAVTALFIMRESQGAFKNDHELESFFSRESMFLFNNWIFLALTGVVFWGTWAELITGFMQDFGLMGNTISLGREYYERIVPWLFLILFVLMGVAPLAAWRKASAKRLGTAMRVPVALTVGLIIILTVLGYAPLVTLAIGLVCFAGFATLMELYKGAAARHGTHGENYALALMRLFARNRRRYGGYVIHLGVVIMGLGIIGSTIYQETVTRTLSPGEFMNIGDYQLRYDEAFDARAIDGRTMFIASMTLFKDGRVVDVLRPRRDTFEGQSTQMNIAGVHSTLENDIYVRLSFYNGNRVSFIAYRNPLIAFVWWGGLLFVIGTAIAVWPHPETAPVTRNRRVSMMARPAAAGD
jgi:cytochrome c-type biogenesis protein CcmF